MGDVLVLALDLQHYASAWVFEIWWFQIAGCPRIVQLHSRIWQNNLPKKT
jgi:hypothetical protein